MRTPLQEWLYEPRVLYPHTCLLGGPEPRPRTPPALLTEATASAHIWGVGDDPGSPQMKIRNPYAPASFRSILENLRLGRYLNQKRVTVS